MQNPFSPPDSHSTNKSQYRLHWRPFIVSSLLVCVLGLFIPTIELFHGSHSLGRAPVWLAYVGIFTPEHRGLALPIIALHLISTLVLGWLGAVLFYVFRPKSSTRPETRKK